MAKNKMNLVIVESPAKAKTIGKYLGPDYKVTASMGHLRDLPKSSMGVDIENGFEPDYQPVKGREDTINELKKAVQASNKVYLATDPDREGEAISWHLKELLKIPDDEVYRVTFNEITKNVVCSSIEKPRKIDKNLVDAQQARRILDRIVGYKLSPLLWKKVKRGLSAGRVQSVATRMVVDREEKIRTFIPEEYWYLDVNLKNSDEDKFSARYYGSKGEKRELKNKEDVEQIKSDVEGASFAVHDVKRSDKQRSPSPPFITSSLQQEASRKLGMTTRRTMSVAQQLYEGVDVEGVGTVGLITYMRTDSLRLSDEAVSSAAEIIKSKYGNEYYPGSPRKYKSKNNAQDAHEAIRPSDPSLEPLMIRGSLTADQYRLYRLIWNRFMASQMSNAVYDSITAEIVASDHIFRASYTSMKFPGFTAIYEESKDEEQEEKEKPIPLLNVGEILKLDSFSEEQKFTQPPARYTEASLVKEMEETGIGRPSTYAPTISTILDREYVIKEGKYLKPTPLGEVVTGLMKERFADIVDLNFTARMEEELDSIERGIKPWKDVLTGFYGPFQKSLDDAEKALEGERIKIPAEETDEICDVCGRKMVIKSGKYGRFLGCSGYPECTFTKPLVVEMPGKCPVCGGRILKRTSKSGHVYYSCEKVSICGFMTWDVPVNDVCPVCGKTMFKKSGRGYNKPFCANEECTQFVPEDQRGYRKKKQDGKNEEAESVQNKTSSENKKTGTVKKTGGKTTEAKEMSKKPSTRNSAGISKS